MCYYYLNVNFCLYLYSNAHCCLFFYRYFPALCLHTAAHFLHNGNDIHLCCNSHLYLLFQCLFYCNLIVSMFSNSVSCIPNNTCPFHFFELQRNCIFCMCYYFLMLLCICLIALLLIGCTSSV